MRVSEGENGGGRMGERERMRQTETGRGEGECEVCAMRIHRCDKLNAWHLLSRIQNFQPNNFGRIQPQPTFSRHKLSTVEFSAAERWAPFMEIEECFKLRLFESNHIVGG